MFDLTKTRSIDFKLGIAIQLDFVTFNLLSAKITKWSNTLKQLSVFDHFVGLALEGLRCTQYLIERSEMFES